MKDSKQAFLNSLDLTDQEMEAYIPIILEDLWELGSMPDYIIALFKKNIHPADVHKVADFGCGKGAVLIRLATEFMFEGLGIDMVHAFIASAQKYAQKYHVADRVKFRAGDIKTMISDIHDQDVVIYGYDSDILGNIKETLLQLVKCLSAQGRIIMEVAYRSDNTDISEGIPSESEVKRQIKESGLAVIDQMVWDIHKIKKVNTRNNSLIQAKITELIAAYPAKAHLFKQYMDNQLEECAEMERNMICSTWLLQ